MKKKVGSWSACYKTEWLIHSFRPSVSWKCCLPFSDLSLSFDFVFFIFAEVFCSLGAFVSFPFVVAGGSSSELSLEVSAYLTRTNRTYLFLVLWENHFWCVQILTLTCFPCCVPFGFHNWGCFSRWHGRCLSLTFGVKFLGKLSQCLIVRTIVIQWFCVRNTGWHYLLHRTATVCWCCRYTERKLPFFFVSTDFFGGTEKGFLAALDAFLANFTRGSLSELSSVFKPESCI